MYTEARLKKLIRCSNDPIYFIENYYTIKTLGGSKLFKLYKYQKEMVKAIHENGFSELITARQAGKTSILAAYLTWYSIFNVQKNVIVKTKKQSFSIDILDHIRFAIDKMPVWIKPKFKTNNKTCIQLENDTKIMAISKMCHLRGYSIDLIALDESDLIDAEDLQDMLPVLVSGSNSKLIASGRLPILLQNVHTLIIPWDKLPRKPKSWKESIIAAIGERSFREEYMCEVLTEVG